MEHKIKVIGAGWLSIYTYSRQNGCHARIVERYPHLGVHDEDFGPYDTPDAALDAAMAHIEEKRRRRA